MANVYTSNIPVPKRYRNGRTYGGDFSFASLTVSSSQGLQSQVVPVEAIQFTNTATPQVTDYDTQYKKIHGQFPRIELIIDNEDGTRHRSQQQPQFDLVTDTDRISRIWFDLGEVKSGYIVIQ